MHGRLQLLSARLLFAAALPQRAAHLHAHVCFRRVRNVHACAFSTTSNADDFAALGLNPLLLPALSAAGIDQPTEVQRAAFEMILSGEDAVLLSETGSGKTLAYTLPLIHRLIELAELPEAIEADSDEPEDNRRRTVPDQALVLVPNRDLAAQVHDVIAGVVETLPDHLKKTISVSSLAAETGADASAAILVSTPAIALKAWRGPETVRWVVLDEADALLAGSWKLTARMNYPIELLIAQVKRAAKLEASATPVPTSRTGGRAGRAKAFYSTRQFVVTGATMPNAGTKNMEEHVQRLLPTAQWFLAERVHKSIDRVKHFFIKIDGDFRAQALQQALKHGPPGKVLIFANTLEMAETAHADASLELGSDGCALFHAGLSTAERADILAAFGRAEPPVLVCTGLASRGIDFTDVAHVLQYDVAHNAVEFMHRVGRTARAGKAGIATTLYTDDRAELIEGIRDALADGSSINHLFSRKRSFTLLRKKARKRDAQMSVALGLEEADDDDDVNLRRNRADKDARRRAKHAAMLDQLGDQ